jgi:hypothetical protein
MCCQVNAVADAKDEDQGVVGAIYNVGIQLGAPIGLAIANIISQAHTPDGRTDDVALMQGYSAAFYAYAVMAGVGIVAVILFAANRDPAQFPEEGGVATLDLEECATIPASSSTGSPYGGDKEEIVENSNEKVSHNDSNSSSCTVGREAVGSSSSANSVTSFGREKERSKY